MGDRIEKPDPFTYHGGDLCAARAAFPEAPEPWIDLSTGVNGQPYPVGALDPHTFTRLPEPDSLSNLEEAAARAYGADPALVIAAPGTQALIQWLPRLFPARRIGILGFTYAEHARSWRCAGASVDAADSLEALGSRDAAVLVNPNNPDGRFHRPEALLELAAKVGLLVVDEAFVDPLPSASSLVPLRPPARTVVLRSFGKFYGLAGLRLGFAVASPDLAPTIRDALGPWRVGGPATAIGRQALEDVGWRAAATSRLRREASRLDALLDRAGAVVVGGTPLFRLAAVDEGPRWFRALGRAGILVRPFTERPEWLRFGIPADPEAWERLADVLLSLRA